MVLYNTDNLLIDSDLGTGKGNSLNLITHQVVEIFVHGLPKIANSLYHFLSDIRYNS